MLSSLNELCVTVEAMSMRLDVYHRSGNSTALYQPMRASPERAFMRIKNDLTNVNNYNVIVSTTVLMRSICRIMPLNAASAAK